MKLRLQFQFWNVHVRSHSATGAQSSPQPTHTGPKQSQMTLKSRLKEASLCHVCLGIPRQCVWMLHPPGGFLSHEDSLSQRCLKSLWSPQADKWRRVARRVSFRKEEASTELLKNRGRTPPWCSSNHRETMLGIAPTVCQYHVLIWQHFPLPPNTED